MRRRRRSRSPRRPSPAPTHCAARGSPFIRATALEYDEDTGRASSSSRYGTAPACFTPLLVDERVRRDHAGDEQAERHAAARASVSSPRTSRTPSPTRQTPTDLAGRRRVPERDDADDEHEHGRRSARDRVHDRELREPVRHRQEREVDELERAARDDERNDCAVRVPERRSRPEERRPRPRSTRPPSPPRRPSRARAACSRARGCTLRQARGRAPRSAYSATMPIAAVVFDFNGTLSDDEPVLCEIFMHLFAEHGRPMSAQEYFDRLAGLSDPEIVRTWLGNDHPDVQAVIDERVDRYRAAVADGSSVHEHAREAVRYAAERVPLAICSGAARAEIEPVVEAAGLAPCFRDDRQLRRRRPRQARPGGLREDARASSASIPPTPLVFEDTEAGIASARAAGVGRVLAMHRTLEPHRLAAGGRADRPHRPRRHAPLLVIAHRGASFERAGEHARRVRARDRDRRRRDRVRRARRRRRAPRRHARQAAAEPLLPDARRGARPHARTRRAPWSS